MLVAINSSMASPLPSVAGSVTEAASIGDFPVVPETRLPLVPVLSGSAPAPEISARAVLVRDRGSGVTIFEKNSAQRLPIASLTKLMTALVVLEHLHEQDEVKITAADVDTPQYRTGFVPGEKIAVSELLKAMLVSSANDAAQALARTAAGSVPEFVRFMNAKASVLRMADTSFTNPVGFDDPGHYSTAADLSRLVEEFLNYPALLEIVKTKSEIISTTDGADHRRLTTTNKLLLKYQEVIGLKTGYTAESKGSLIILVSRDIGGESAQYYSIILGSASRETETALILDWIKENFIWK